MVLCPTDKLKDVYFPDNMDGISDIFRTEVFLSLQKYLDQQIRPKLHMYKSWCLKGKKCVLFCL